MYFTLYVGTYIHILRMACHGKTALYSGSTSVSKVDLEALWPVLHSHNYMTCSPKETKHKTINSDGDW